MSGLRREHGSWHAHDLAADAEPADGRRVRCGPGCGRAAPTPNPSGGCAVMRLMTVSPVPAGRRTPRAHGAPPPTGMPESRHGLPVLVGDGPGGDGARRPGAERRDAAGRCCGAASPATWTSRDAQVAPDSCQQHPKAPPWPCLHLRVARWPGCWPVPRPAGHRHCSVHRPPHEAHRVRRGGWAWPDGGDGRYAVDVRPLDGRARPGGPGAGQVWRVGAVSPVAA